MKKLQLYIISFIVLAVGVVGMWFYALYSPVVTADAGVVYELRAGSPKNVVVSELSQQNLIRYPILFSLYVYSQKDAHLKRGEYLFPKGASTASIWKQITHGTGLVYHPFTIIPGWSFKQLRNALAQTQGLRHFTANLDEKQIMALLGSPNLAAEGEFFPETYYYTKGIQDLVILKRAFDLMQTSLNDAWAHRAMGLPYKDAYQALTAASLIEKEAFLNSERPVIAGVLINRLRKDMLLQFDPTVIYGLGERYNGKIHKSDLVEDTAYNTYVHKGLPPTPIAMPSRASITAAMHPEDNDYFYFVAKGDGSHQFSKSLVQHNEAVTEANQRQSYYFNGTLVQKYLHPLISDS